MVASAAVSSLAARGRTFLARFSKIAVLLALGLAGCGPKSMDARMRDADKISDKLGGLLDEAERALGELEPKKAQEALDAAKQLLEEPDLKLSPEREMFVSRHAELVPKLAEVQEARRQRDVEEAVRSERAEIGPSLQAMKDAAEAIAGPKVDEKSVRLARDSVTALEKAVGASDDRRILANKDSSFHGYLKRAKGETEKARAEVTKAEKKLKFLAGPVALKQKATDELKASKKEKDLEKKRALVGAAAGGFGRCLSAGLEFTKGGLAAEKVAIGAAVTTIESFLETCKAAQQSADQALAKLPKPKSKSKPKR